MTHLSLGVPPSESLLADVLVQAYRATLYRVDASEPFVLRVDEPSPELAALLTAHRSSSALFITAWNPYSEPHSQADNEVGQQALKSAFAEENLAPVFLGIGVDPEGAWPGEESFLVLGADFECAHRLALKFRQNAFLWAGHDAIPRLVLTR